MEGLQRSAVSFRRQGSSGLIWDDKLLNEELKKLEHNDDSGEKPREEGSNKSDSAAAAVKEPSPAAGLTIERSRSNGGRGFRTGRVSPAIDPPSPKVSACGFCGAFGNKNNTRRRAKKAGKRVV